MNILGRIFVVVFYTIGALLVAVPFFIVAVVAIVAYPIIVIFSDILASLGINKR